VVAIPAELVKNVRLVSLFSLAARRMRPMISLRNETNNTLSYATTHSAGFDICASEDAVIPAKGWALVATGLRIVENASAQPLTLGGVSVSVLPELQIRPRSGLAAKFGISLVNTPCTIDADYRGEIKLPVLNHGNEPFVVKAGDRIAQGVCALVFQAPGILVKDAVRGEGGFGSTGTRP
jgi:dUTP pyrophosphatase